MKTKIIKIIKISTAVLSAVILVYETYQSNKNDS